MLDALTFRLSLVKRSVRAGWLFATILLRYLLVLGMRKVLGRRRTDVLLERTHRSAAVRARRGFLALEGVYVKIGQVVSMLTGFLPDAWLEELESMQDSVPPKPFDVIRPRIESELGAPLEVRFGRLDPVPVASASLGEVHLAELPDGTEVAVKVQYPGIDRIVDTDLAMVRIVLKVIALFLPGLRVERIHADLSEVIREELVYTQEGLNCEAIAANFAGDDHVRFPEVVWSHTTDRVLTQTRMGGMKITDVDAITAAGLEPRAVIEVLVRAYFKQLLVDGLYHADPHPGNFFVNALPADGSVAGNGHAEPAITFLDFGAVARFPEAFKEGMRTVVYGYMTQDDGKVVEGMVRMGFASAGGDEAVFRKAVRHYMDKLLHLDISDFSKIDISEFDVWRNLDEMKVSFRDITRAFEVPRNWFYVERTLGLLLGLCARLDPTVDAFLYGFPYAVEFVFGGDSTLAALWGRAGSPEEGPAPETVPAGETERGPGDGGASSGAEGGR